MDGSYGIAAPTVRCGIRKGPICGDPTRVSSTVVLPDTGRLLSLPRDGLRLLGERLAGLELGSAFATRVARVGERLDDPLRAPMRIWHARRARDPAATVGRLFMLHDPVDPADAQDALGDLAPLLDAGFVVPGAEGLVSPVHLALVDDTVCFGDVPGQGGEAVMPACGATRDLVRAALPREPIESALDLGCGAAPVALQMARSAARVVATDVSPRALDFARLNLALHDVHNVELRQGDLYDAVRGERFDRIAAQPPFVARPDGAAPSTFIHGGARGDEVSLRVLAGAAGHLTPEGRAVVLGDWPVIDRDALDARARAAVGDGPEDVLVLQSPPKNLDEYCAHLAAAEHAELGAAFRHAAILHRGHLDAMGLRAIAVGCVVVTPGSGWTTAVSIRHLHDAPLTDEAIGRLLASRRLAFGPRQLLAAAHLRFPPGSRSVEQALPEGGPPSLVVQPPAGDPAWPAVLDAALAEVVVRIAGAGRVDEAGGEQAVDAAREALLRGALVPS
jgi:precorrin-6B methylase 2